MTGVRHAIDYQSLTPVSLTALSRGFILNLMQLSFNKGVSCSLRDLKEGQSGVLDRLDLPEALAHRLMELGFLPGMEVTAAKAAPGGDPRVFRVDGAEVALRLETASHLFLTPNSK